MIADCTAAAIPSLCAFTAARSLGSVEGDDASLNTLVPPGLDRGRIGSPSEGIFDTKDENTACAVALAEADSTVGIPAASV